MSSQLLPTDPHPDRFPVAFREQALVDFGGQMDQWLAILEQRHVKPRKHPRLVFEGERARGAK